MSDDGSLQNLIYKMQVYRTAAALGTHLKMAFLGGNIKKDVPRVSRFNTTIQALDECGVYFFNTAEISGSPNIMCIVCYISSRDRCVISTRQEAACTNRIS